MQGFRRVHFIGIGGAGMSGIARVLHQRGYEVSGSDLKQSRYTRQLAQEGLRLIIGHKAETIDELKPDVVVVSTAIPATNPELMRAQELGITLMRRAQMLAELARGRTTIAFAGTHGKTTTSSMAATCLDKMGLEPTFLIGGLIDGYNTNGNNGAGEYFVCEADESDGSFLYLSPSIVVITNIEADHLDHYSGIEEIEETFLKFMKSAVPSSSARPGCVVVCADEKGLVDLARSSEMPLISYGFSDEADVRCTLLERKDSCNLLQSCFRVDFPDGQGVEVHIDHNPGVHNVLNATAVLASCYAAGLDLQQAAYALSSFSGVRRRFDYVGSFKGVAIVDDYAHHPTEIKMTLAAAKSLGYKSIRVAFQPHRYSRTQLLLNEFGLAFEDADTTIFTDVYAAGERPIPGVNGKSLIRAVQEHRPHADMAYFPNRSDLIAYLIHKCEPGDLLLTMGAGDITSLGQALLETYAQQEAQKAASHEKDTERLDLPQNREISHE